MSLFRHGAFADDDWQFPEDGAPLPATGGIAVPKARHLAEREALTRRNEATGIVLAPGDRLDDIAADIPRLGLVVITIPKYTDGRPYSLARLLRDRYGFRGELRAAGDVLRDQIALLLRAGFDAFDVSHAGTIAALREKHIVAVRHHYQPASAEASETKPDRRPWRRVSAPLS